MCSSVRSRILQGEIYRLRSSDARIKAINAFVITNRVRPVQKQNPPPQIENRHFSFDARVFPFTRFYVPREIHLRRDCISRVHRLLRFFDSCPKTVSPRRYKNRWFFQTVALLYTLPDERVVIFFKKQIVP